MNSHWIHIHQTHKLVIAYLETEYLSEELSLELVKTLTDRMRYQNGHYFILDLSKVQVIVSACLAAFVKFLQDLELVRGRVALVNCQPNVALVLKMTRLDRILIVCDSTDEAKMKLHAA